MLIQLSEKHGAERVNAYFRAHHKQTLKQIFTKKYFSLKIEYVTYHLLHFEFYASSETQNIQKTFEQIVLRDHLQIWFIIISKFK